MAMRTQGNLKTEASNEVKDLKCKRVISGKVIRSATTKVLNARNRRLEAKAGETDLALELKLKLVQDLVGRITGEPISIIKTQLDADIAEMEVDAVESNMEVDAVESNMEFKVEPQLEEKAQEKLQVEKTENLKDVGIPLNIWCDLLMLADVASAQLLQRPEAGCSAERIP